MTVRDPHTEVGDGAADRVAATTSATAAEPAAVATEPAPLATPPCPRCGTPLRDDQDWCLNCGAAATTRVAAPTGWRAPLAIAAAVLALAFIGLGVAFLAVSNDSDELTRLGAQVTTTQALPAAPTPAATPTPTPTPPAAGQAVPDAATGDDELPGLDSLPEATGGGSQEPGSTDDDTGGTNDTGGTRQVGSWPFGRSAFTVVLLSSPTRAAANRRARQLAGGGTDVGVLDSDDFRSLNGGYFVVFSGQYDSRDAAEDALAGLSADAPGSYVRRVTPR